MSMIASTSGFKGIVTESLSRQAKKDLRKKSKKVFLRRKGSFKVWVYAETYHDAYMNVLPSTTVKNLRKQVLHEHPTMGVTKDTIFRFNDLMMEEEKTMAFYGVHSKDYMIHVELDGPQHFSSLTPGLTYYTKAGMLYEDTKGQVFCENSFTFGIQLNHLCTSHTVPVCKDEKGVLHLGPLPESVKLERGEVPEWYIEVHGPGMERYMRTKIPVVLTVTDKNRKYTVKDLPDGKTGWLTSWGIQKKKDSSGNYRAPFAYDVEIESYYGDSGLFVMKYGDKLIVDRSTFEKTKEQYPDDENSVYCGVPESDYLDVVFKDLLPKSTNTGPRLAFQRNMGKRETDTERHDLTFFDEFPSTSVETVSQDPLPDYVSRSAGPRTYFQSTMAKRALDTERHDMEFSD